MRTAGRGEADPYKYTMNERRGVERSHGIGWDRCGSDLAAGLLGNLAKVLSHSYIVDFARRFVPRNTRWNQGADQVVMVIN